MATKPQLLSTSSGLTSNFNYELLSTSAGLFSTGTNSTWSFYPAISDVDLAGFSLVNSKLLSTGDLQVSSINGADIKIFNSTVVIQGVTITNNTVAAGTVEKTTSVTDTFNSVVGAVGSLVDVAQKAVGGALADTGAVLQQVYWGTAATNQVVNLTNGVVTLATGIQGLIDSRQNNNISGGNIPGQTTNVYETINGTTQFQFSTLGSAVTTVFRTTDQKNPNITLGREVFISTIIPAGSKAVRSVSDPLSMPILSTQLLSTTNYLQSFGQWHAILEPDYALSTSGLTNIGTFCNQGPVNITGITNLYNDLYMNANNIYSVNNLFTMNIKNTGILSNLTFCNVGNAYFTNTGSTYFQKSTIFSYDATFSGANLQMAGNSISNINNLNANYANIGELEVSSLKASTVTTQNIIDNFVSTASAELDTLIVSTIINKSGILFITPSTLFDISKITSLTGTQFTGYNNNILNYELDTTVNTEPLITYPFPSSGNTIEFFWPQVGTWASVINTFASGPGNTLYIVLGVSTGSGTPPLTGFTDIKNTNQTTLYVSVTPSYTRYTVPLGSTYRFSWTTNGTTWSVDTSPSPILASTLTNFNITQNFAGVNISTSDILNVNATSIFLNSPLTQVNKLVGLNGYISSLQTDFISSGTLQITNLSTTSLSATGTITSGGNITTAANVIGVNGTLSGLLTAGSVNTTNLYGSYLTTSSINIVTQQSTPMILGTYTNNYNVTSYTIPPPQQLITTETDMTITSANPGYIYAGGGGTDIITFDIQGNTWLNNTLQTNKNWFYSLWNINTAVRVNISTVAGYSNINPPLAYNTYITNFIIKGSLSIPFYTSARGYLGNGSGNISLIWSSLNDFSTAAYVPWTGLTYASHQQTVQTVSTLSLNTTAAYLVSSPSVNIQTNPSSNIPTISFNGRNVEVFSQKVSGFIESGGGGAWGKGDAGATAVSPTGQTFPVSQYNCLVTQVAANVYGQYSLALNEQVWTTSADGNGNWAFHFYCTTATVGGSSPNFYAIAGITMIPYDLGHFSGFQSADHIGEGNGSIPFFPAIGLSTIYTSTVTMLALENISLNAATGIPTFLGNGNLALNANSNIDLMANYDIIAGAGHNISLTGTNAINLNTSIVNVSGGMNLQMNTLNGLLNTYWYGGNIIGSTSGGGDGPTFSINAISSINLTGPSNINITSPFIDVYGIINTHNNPLLIRDQYQGLCWGYTAPYNIGIDGPFVFGYSAGALGVTHAGNDKALVWDDSSVNIYKHLYMNTCNIYNVNILNFNGSDKYINNLDHIYGDTSAPGGGLAIDYMYGMFFNSAGHNANLYVDSGNLNMINYNTGINIANYSAAGAGNTSIYSASNDLYVGTGLGHSVIINGGSNVSINCANPGGSFNVYTSTINTQSLGDTSFNTYGQTYFNNGGFVQFNCGGGVYMYAGNLNMNNNNISNVGAIGGTAYGDFYVQADSSYSLWLTGGTINETSYGTMNLTSYGDTNIYTYYGSNINLISDGNINIEATRTGCNVTLYSPNIQITGTNTVTINTNYSTWTGSNNFNILGSNIGITSSNSFDIVAGGSGLILNAGSTNLTGGILDMCNHSIVNVATLNTHSIYKYGEWACTATSSLTANTPQAITWDTGVYAVGFSPSSGGTYLTASNSGYYNIITTILLSKSGGGGTSSACYAWIETSGGTQVANSCRHIDIGGGATGEISINQVVYVNGSFRIMVAADSSSVSFTTLAAQTSPYTRPQTPAGSLSVFIIA